MRRLNPLAVFVFNAGVLAFTTATFLSSTGMLTAFRDEPLPTPRMVQSHIFEPVVALFIEATVTAYCPCHECTGKTGPWSERTTSLMDPATVCDGVAADYARALPVRARLFIPGVGLREVDDTGGAMRSADGTHIDVRMDSHELANEFGRQKLTIILYI